MQHQPFTVKGLEGPGPVLSVPEFPEGIVLDNRDLMLGQERHQLSAVFQRHAATQRITETRNNQAGGDLSLLQRITQNLHVNAVGGMGRYFQSPQSQFFQRLQKDEKCRRFDCHHIPRLADRPQGEGYRPRTSGGNGDIVRRKQAAAGKSPLGYLCAQQGRPFGGVVFNGAGPRAP